MATSQASIAVSYKTILLATDFRSSSEATLPYVSTLACCFGSMVIAAHAVPFEPLSGLAAVPPVWDIDLEWQSAQDAMRTYKETHPFQGIAHEFVLERGEPLGVIRDLVQQRSVDLVVQGTHGRRGLHKVFAGSVAEEIFRSVLCPVLTVGPKVQLPVGGNWQPRRILFATEFAEGSLHALPHALAIADATQAAELLILHTEMLVPWEEQSDMAVRARQRLGNLVPQAEPHRCSIAFEVCFDLPAPGILDKARTRQADLIVMGAHHASFPRFDAHMIGTTACEVISRAHCPVLTVQGHGFRP
jgi:nucleotide-binding universal stress UspA family protein